MSEYQRELIVLHSRVQSKSDDEISAHKSGPTRLTANLEDEKPEMKISRRKHTEMDIQQEDIVGMAPPVPVRLIEPLRNLSAQPYPEPDKVLSFANENKIAWNIAATKADSSSYNGKGVVVSILDDGINKKHLAFPKNNIDIKTKNFTTDPDLAEDAKHGTHCAGTIFGRTVNGVRIGVAPGIDRALVAKVIGKNADTGSVLDAIKWSLDNGANIISMSLGFDFVDHKNRLQTIEQLSEHAAMSETLKAFEESVMLVDSFLRHAKELSRDKDTDVLFIAATGNQSNIPRYRVRKMLPASAAEIISVGAAGPEDLQLQKLSTLKIAHFSNSEPTLCAPGVGVLSADASSESGLCVMSGTSMACPHIVGLAALYWEKIRKENGEHFGDISSLVKASLTTSALEGDVKVNGMPVDRGIGMPVAPL